MPTGVFLINGISLPYHVIDSAIDWAHQNKASLTGIFIYSDEKNAESYPFPSDIEQAETRISENEGEKELETIIRHHATYAENLCALKSIPVTTYQYKNPDPEILRPHLQQATILFVDPETFTGDAASDITGLNFEDIAGLSSASIVEVRP